MKIIGEAYRELQELVKLYAKENLPVLFTGQTGTGKELFMQLYMKESKRTGKKMTINCAALSDDLLRSEVFGHEKGAFTGAIKGRLGKVFVCNNGILAFDEIGDATPQFQAAILRVCEDSTYSPLGSDEEKKTNTLIIAATNKPENLRYDLKERFHVLPIPPLQKEDIPTLVNHFLKKQLKDEVIQELTIREYRGNIRELKRICERLKVEKGEKVFAKKPNETPPYHFDYYRFRREMNTWDRFIQPLVNHYGKEYGFEKCKYQYMPWDGDSLEWIMNRDRDLNPSSSEKKITAIEDDSLITSSNFYNYMCYLKRFINEENDLPLPDRIQLSLNHIPEVCNEFNDHIRYIFDCSFLPCVLGYIYLKAERPTCQAEITITKPNLSRLLDLSLRQAEKEFLNHYYDYNVKKYANIKELEEAVGMSKKSLDQKYKRNQ